MAGAVRFVRNERMNEFDALSVEERKAIIKSWDGEKLIQSYSVYYDTFNPLDSASITTFELIKAEIKERCQKH